MIREAKGVAIHDLSFWANTLPLLDRFPRVIHDYKTRFSAGVPLSLTSETGRDLHDRTLDRFIEVARGLAVPGKQLADRLAGALVTMMGAKAIRGVPEVKVPIAGCGVVVGGSCDIVWHPLLVELKLTAKQPALRDVRQVLIYAGLLHLSQAPTPEIGIVANPRLGVAVEFELGELLLMTGGLRIDEFSSRLGDFLVSSGQSN